MVSEWREWYQNGEIGLRMERMVTEWSKNEENGLRMEKMVSEWHICN